ncbi:MAG: hypothetical protein R3Y43_05095 [Alphaproteobacteria bacterium]
MDKNKKNKFKWENVYPSDKSDFEMTYKKISNLLAHLQSDIQQLAAAYKEMEKK